MNLDESKPSVMAARLSAAPSSCDFFVTSPGGAKSTNFVVNTEHLRLRLYDVEISQIDLVNVSGPFSNISDLKDVKQQSIFIAITDDSYIFCRGNMTSQGVAYTFQLCLNGTDRPIPIGRSFTTREMKTMQNFTVSLIYADGSTVPVSKLPSLEPWSFTLRYSR
jgi:hypothetical protein